MTPDLNERRSEFIYEAARLAAIAAEAPIVPKSWSEREQAFRTQFLEVIERQMGPQRSSSPEELHDSWVQAYLAMDWTHGDRDLHRTGFMHSEPVHGCDYCEVLK